MDSRKITFGLVLVVIGFLLLVRSLGIVYFDFDDFVGTLIPLGLIGLGVWLIIRKKREQDRMAEHINSYAHMSGGASYGGSQRKTAGDSSSQKAAGGQSSQHSYSFEGKTAQGPSVSRDGFQQYKKAIGDLHVDLSGVNMRNVEVSGFAGDIDVITSRGELSEGLNRLIISEFLGDVKVFVPPVMWIFWVDAQRVLATRWRCRRMSMRRLRRSCISRSAVLWGM